MAQRKSIKVKAELTALELELKKLEQESKLAEKEELSKLESVKSQVEQIAIQNDVFCGVILTHEDLLNVLKVALESGEAIKIKCNAYHNE